MHSSWQGKYASWHERTVGEMQLFATGLGVVFWEYTHTKKKKNSTSSFPFEPEGLGPCLVPKNFVKFFKFPVTSNL